jgi:protease IV
MEATQNTNTTTSVPYEPQQKVVYVQQPKSQKRWWIYLLGCGGCFFLIALSCIVPLVLLGAVSSSVTTPSDPNDFSNITESTILEAGNPDASMSAKLAVINVTGEITYSMPEDSVAAGAASNSLIMQLQKAKKDTSVDAVLLRFNTPGGALAAAEPICREIKEVRKTKPVYSFIDSMGASLGYLLPNCTEYIYTRDSAVTGSIGVIVQAVDFYGVLEKLGGKVVFITNSSGDQKSGEDVFEEGSDTYKTYQKILDEGYEYFVNKVYEGRKENHASMTLIDIRKYADGRILSGKQAKEINFVDELAELPDAISSIISKEGLGSKNVEVVEYQIIGNPFAELFGGLQASLKSADLKNQVTKTELKVLMQAGLVNPVSSGD